MVLSRTRRIKGRPESLARSRGSIGHTRRPLGTGGAGTRNLNLSQWAQSRYVGYNSSQIPPIDRPPVGAAAIATLLQDVGVHCPPAQYTISVIAADQLFTFPFVGTAIPERSVAAALGQGVTELQVRLEWATGAGFHNRMDLDIGAGFQMSLTAQSIQASIILPNGAVDLDAQHGQDMVAGPLDPLTGLAGAFHTALIFGTAQKEQAWTFQEWQLTRALRVPQNTTTRIAIPSGADFVEGMEITLPSAATPFLNFVTGEQQATVFLDVGQFSVSTTPRRFDRVRIPVNARFIQSGAVVPAADRLFLLTFTSRP